MRTIDELGISPAPWFINNDEYGDTNEVLCQYNLDGVIHTKTLARTNSHFKSSEHDARLIAAAPELLAFAAAYYVRNKKNSVKVNPSNGDKYQDGMMVMCKQALVKAGMMDESEVWKEEE